jgi:biotin synthase
MTIEKIKTLLNKEDLSKEDLIYLLESKGEEEEYLFVKAAEVRDREVGKNVYFRGLIEYSNKCIKSCYYCGVNNSNKKIKRYEMTDEEVLEAVRFAHKNLYASIVLQSGERSDKLFTDKIESLLKKINQETKNQLHITLSLGEQSEETYKRWKKAGAHRYLLRIETSNKELYRKLHPDNRIHSYEERVEAIKRLISCGYQVGTGVMTGLPWQEVSHLADDILFFKKMNIDMFGLGPYIEHEETPLYQFKNTLWSKSKRLDYSLKMVAILRIWMKNVNIAATTAMQTLDPFGREKAIKAGANVIMPNLTPVHYRESYLLYEDKPCLDEDASKCQGCLSARIASTGYRAGFGEWGDSRHFIEKQKK